MSTCRLHLERHSICILISSCTCLVVDDAPAVEELPHLEDAHGITCQHSNTGRAKNSRSNDIQQNTFKQLTVSLLRSMSIFSPEVSGKVTLQALSCIALCIVHCGAFLHSHATPSRRKASGMEAIPASSLLHSVKVRVRFTSSLYLLIMKLRYSL